LLQVGLCPLLCFYTKDTDCANNCKLYGPLVMAGYAQTKRAEATGQLAIYLECRRDATQAAFTVRHR